MTNIAEDVYTIISKESKKSIQIDLTTPFVLNSSSTLINVPFEDILIKNSIGILSPAAASLDQFKSYAHRGDEFKKFVENLSKD